MPNANPIAGLLPVIERHWGFRALRPLQAEAMQAALAGRDSLVVMPTGGGKSLCYQAPAVHRGGTTVVVSPLIALMKDQVDGLQANGVAAAQIDSSLTSSQRSATELKLIQGELRLLFVSPERIAVPDFGNLLRRAGVTTFAIDEAHCISHWGHDFRPEYRQMGRLHELFPGVSVHAYTATATEQVRKDICTQLNLQNPVVLVGNFDRPNLTYRILPRLDADEQILAIIKRHAKEAGIIYCLSRRSVDETTAMLNGRGIKALGYHAGMDPEARKRVQDEFISERCDLIVATIAFGMGIDRSNIRYIIHAAMPKSIEHYQQETGRAGRDGLEAECVLLHSGGDIVTWKWIMEKSANESNADPSFLKNVMKHLNDLDRYCRGAVCRHKALVNHFGQKYDKPTCAACDLCLGDSEPVPDALVIAQKILSCVARVDQRFGAGHVTSVLRGENLERVRSLGHDKLSTFGLLREHSKNELRDWISQLIGQEVLVQEGTEYPVLKLNDASWEVMKKQRPARLMRLVQRKDEEQESSKPKAAAESWEGVDRGLFEELRGFRKSQAEARGVPPYVVMNDFTLRDLARNRPSTTAKLRLIHGIGERKIIDFGEPLLRCIAEYCACNQLPIDKVVPKPARTEPTRPVKLSQTRIAASDLFKRGVSIEKAMMELALTRNTIMQYLVEYIRREQPATIEPWVVSEQYERIAEAILRVGGDRAKPIFIALNEKIPYDDIRLVMAHMTVPE